MNIKKLTISFIVIALIIGAYILSSKERYVSSVIIAQHEFVFSRDIVKAPLFGFNPDPQKRSAYIDILLPEFEYRTSQNRKMFNPQNTLNIHIFSDSNKSEPSENKNQVSSDDISLNKNEIISQKTEQFNRMMSLQDNDSANSPKALSDDLLIYPSLSKYPDDDIITNKGIKKRFVIKCANGASTLPNPICMGSFGILNGTVGVIYTFNRDHMLSAESINNHVINLIQQSWRRII